MSQLSDNEREELERMGANLAGALERIANSMMEITATFAVTIQPQAERIVETFEAIAKGMEKADEAERIHKEKIIKIMIVAIIVVAAIGIPLAILLFNK